MIAETNHLPYRIARRAVNQGARTLMGNHVGFDKLATGPNNETRSCLQMETLDSLRF